MFYLIYKTTNIVNGKFYIGKHKTNEITDSYMGSGKRLKYAIKKYGIENFHREILHVCRTEKQMNILEKILVVPDPETNYNLCIGGQGGFSFINTNRLWNTAKHLDAANRNVKIATEKLKHLYKEDPCWRKMQSEKIKISHPSTKDGYVNPFKGKTHSSEWREYQSIRMKGKQEGYLNSQYGTVWINNGMINKKIKKEDFSIWVELGFERGRISQPREDHQLIDESAKKSK